MLDFYIAPALNGFDTSHLPSLSIGGPVYSFLSRYFRSASLAQGSFEFLNLYEDTELTGYQLDRLEAELKEALADVSGRPAFFKVFMGWHGNHCNLEAESWDIVEKAAVTEAANVLLNLIHEAQCQGMAIVAYGD